jgi:predicted transcriptional regulator
VSSTTTLKLPEELKARITAAALAAQQTPHAWMIEALAAQAELSERRRELIGSALAAREEVARYGLVFDADEVFSYLREKLAGKPASRPRPVKL